MRGVIKILVLGMVVMVVAQPSYDEKWKGEGTGSVVVDGNTIHPWARWTAWIENDYTPGKDTIWGVWHDTVTDAYGNIYGHRNESNGYAEGKWDCVNYDVEGRWTGIFINDSCYGNWLITSGASGNGSWWGHREEP